MTTGTRTALLDAAEHAARSRGFDGFSYADLSDAVGIRKASIHYHFPTKADLTAELMARYAARVTDLLAEISAAPGTGADRLKAIVAIYREALRGGDMTCLCVALTVAFDSVPPVVTRQMSAFRRDVAVWLEQAYQLGSADGSIRAVAAAAMEARAMLATLEGAQLAARTEGDTGIFDAALGLQIARCVEVGP